MLLLKKKIITILLFKYKFILVVNKASLINMEALTEENNFGMALSERQSTQNQGQGNT